MIETRRRQGEVCSERASQIRSREEARRQRADEEQLFAQMWEGDRRAKQERESQEARRQRESNAEQVSFLRMQMEAAEQQRAEDRQLKEEEAQILVRAMPLPLQTWHIHTSQKKILSVCYTLVPSTACENLGMQPPLI